MLLRYRVGRSARRCVINKGITVGRHAPVVVLPPIIASGHNHVAAPAQTQSAGFSKGDNPSADVTFGRPGNFQSGETIAHYAAGSRYGQYIRNIVLWSSLARPVCALDVDGDGQVLTLTYGLLIMRKMHSVPDAAVVAGAVNPARTQTSTAANHEGSAKASSSRDISHVLILLGRGRLPGLR